MPWLKHCQRKAQKQSRGWLLLLCLDPLPQLYLINHLLEALSGYAWHGWEKSRTKNMSYRGIYSVIRKVLMMRRREERAEGDLTWAVLSNDIKHTFRQAWGGQLTSLSKWIHYLRKPGDCPQDSGSLSQERGICTSWDALLIPAWGSWPTVKVINP